ncbi:alpha/beta hydrolase family protein [Nannocystis bainbridge]|uniref:Prolyl oligopeptidase family serine peptidase n=1 Tax=Nannocystis bainbridge TaxID=2995303 RepID=A0ABT5ED59_9BACT|nr:prolyl oligopeptidase family serine peptidase [Nannocystis bainbridge]MDC0722777.1 prolyl oligopeptidase family serine peptidase [Nannocystis bainbridge]
MKNNVFGRVARLCLLLPVGACVWTPNSRTSHESSAAISMQGYAATSGSAVQLLARNWNSGAFELVDTATASTSASFTGPDMYAWSKTLSLAAKFWRPDQAGCSAGRAEIRAVAGGDPFRTFTDPAGRCAFDKVVIDGEHPAAAGNACSDGDEVILFDNNGTCGVAETGGLATVYGPVTGPIDGVSVTWEVVSYPVQGNTIYGLICRPSAAGAHPVQIFNHGGWWGLGYGGEPEACGKWAAKGWVVAMSSYRGERLHLGPSHSWKSGGSVELCNGEVTDVLRMTDLVLAKPYANSSKVLMHGLSHGGCITTRAVQRGAPVQAAIDVAGPSEWASLYASLGWWLVGALPTDPPTTPFPTLMAGWVGTPSLVPRAYEWRSSKFVAEDLAARTDVKYLRMQGTADTIVPPEHACKLAKAAFGSAGSKNWHFNNAAGVTPVAPTGCTATDASLTWQSGAKPTTSWPDNRYVFVYDALPHVVVPGDGTPPAVANAFGVDYTNFVNALNWGVVY